MARRRDSRRARTRPAKQEPPWVASYYVEEDGSVPAREALYADELPRAVRLALLARVVAVRDYPPPPSRPAARSGR